jgi:hypothetical protein
MEEIRAGCVVFIAFAEIVWKDYLNIVTGKYVAQYVGKITNSLQAEWPIYRLLSLSICLWSWLNQWNSKV